MWENETTAYLNAHPEKLEDYLKKLQGVINKELEMTEAVPNCFCIWNSFPSAHSGKRDISYIKNKIDGLISIENDG